MTPTRRPAQILALGPGRRPGEDAEGIDAGELTTAEPVDSAVVDGITPALWQPVAADPAAMTSDRMRQAAETGRMGGRGLFDAVPATDELLAKVAALPPATDEPGIDEAAAQAPDPEFGLRRLLRAAAAGLRARPRPDRAGRGAAAGCCRC